ncbi:MAG: restriction endonuclease subunit S [Desulfovibrio sp.]|nr:restriction endonuclease subunit S [Desulfovibrio sp.]
MPEDWRDGVLGDILNLIKHPVKAGECTESSYVPIDTISMNSLALTDFRPNSEAQSSLFTFKKDDILIGAMRVYFHRVSIVPFDGITRTTCFVLRPIDIAYLEYVLLLCNEDGTIDFAQHTSKGSTMPYAIWENGLACLPVIIPPLEVAWQFSEAVCSIIQRLRDSLFEIRNLKNLRDTLNLRDTFMSTVMGWILAVTMPTRCASQNCVKLCTGSTRSCRKRPLRKPSSNCGTLKAASYPEKCGLHGLSAKRRPGEFL